MRHIWYKLIFITGVFSGIIAGFGASIAFILHTYPLQSWLPWIVPAMSEKIGRTVQIEKASLSGSWTLDLRLQNVILSSQKDQKKPTLLLQNAHIQMNIVQFLPLLTNFWQKPAQKKALVLKLNHLSLSGVQINIARNINHEWDFADILARFPSDPKQPSLFNFHQSALENLQLHNININLNLFDKKQKLNVNLAHLSAQNIGLARDIQTIFGYGISFNQPNMNLKNTGILSTTLHIKNHHNTLHIHHKIKILNHLLNINNYNIHHLLHPSEISCNISLKKSEILQCHSKKLNQQGSFSTSNIALDFAHQGDLHIDLYTKKITSQNSQATLALKKLPWAYGKIHNVFTLQNMDFLFGDKLYLSAQYWQTNTSIERLAALGNLTFLLSGKNLESNLTTHVKFTDSVVDLYQATHYLDKMHVIFSPKILITAKTRHNLPKPRYFMEKFKLKLPDFVNQSAFSNANIASQWQYQYPYFRAVNTHGKLDDSTFDGNFTVKMRPFSLNAALNLDQINLDLYEINNNNLTKNKILPEVYIKNLPIVLNLNIKKLKFKNNFLENTNIILK